MKNTQPTTEPNDRPTFTREQLERWAFLDGLTNLPNRRSLAIAAIKVGAARRYWVSIDLDGFKRAQDADGRGHAWGDGALKDFARHLRSVIRRGPSRDMDAFEVARIGGDEFVAVTDHPKAAERIAAHARTWHYAEVTASAGVGRSKSQADSALYAAKKLARSQAA